MKRNLFKEIFFDYIVNDRAREIHAVKYLTSRCRVGLMTRARYCNYRQYKRLLKQGYNGCRYCNKVEDRG